MDQPNDTPKQWYSVDDLAERYGVPKPSIYAWFYRGTGPERHRFGRSVRVSHADLLAWERDRRVPA